MSVNIIRIISVTENIKMTKYIPIKNIRYIEYSKNGIDIYMDIGTVSFSLYITPDSCENFKEVNINVLSLMDSDKTLTFILENEVSDEYHLWVNQEILEVCENKADETIVINYALSEVVVNKKNKNFKSNMACGDNLILKNLSEILEKLDEYYFKVCYSSNNNFFSEK